MSKELNVRLISHPAITESGVYDAVFAVNGEVAEREFEVSVNAIYDYEGDTNCYNLRYATVTVTCCNEDDEALANTMERKLKTVIESCMWE